MNGNKKQVRFAIDREDRAEFTPHVAQRLTRERRNVRFAIVDHVRQLVLQYVRLAASQGKYQCIARIPGFIPGMPIFNVTHVRDAIISQLNRGGWRVSPVQGGDDTVLVQWHPAPSSSGGSRVRGGHNPARVFT